MMRGGGGGEGEGGGGGGFGAKSAASFINGPLQFRHECTCRARRQQVGHCRRASQRQQLPPRAPPRLRVRVAVRAVAVRKSPTDRPQRQHSMYVPSACQLARSNSVCVPAFPIADARALDVHEISSGRDVPGYWAALLGAGCTGGTVCVCSDALALWAVHMPLQQQPQPHTPSFIKHRLLSFPLCKRIILGDPSQGQPLIRAASAARCMEW
jgi:hypothetical protein